jgi:hypothetical protein
MVVQYIYSDALNGTFLAQRKKVKKCAHIVLFSIERGFVSYVNINAKSRLDGFDAFTGYRCHLTRMRSFSDLLILESVLDLNQNRFI